MATEVSRLPKGILTALRAELATLVYDFSVSPDPEEVGGGGGQGRSQEPLLLSPAVE